MGQLRDRMEQALILKNLSPATRRNYLLYCRKFAVHDQRSPAEMGETEIRWERLNRHTPVQTCLDRVCRFRRSRWLSHTPFPYRHIQ